MNPLFAPDLCEVEGCTELSEAFCITAWHHVCSEHHDLFHDGEYPKPIDSLRKLNLKWKKKNGV